MGNKNIDAEEIERIIPEKYKFLDSYDSLRLHIQQKVNLFTAPEKSWFCREYALKTKRRVSATFLEMIPYILKRKHCPGFLYCMHKYGTGRSLSQIATHMGIHSAEINRIKNVLEDIELIIVKYEIPGTTKCYLNDGTLKPNGVKPIPSILNLIFEMMEKEIGKTNLEKAVSVGKNVQNDSLKKTRSK